MLKELKLENYRELTKKFTSVAPGTLIIDERNVLECNSVSFDFSSVSPLSLQKFNSSVFWMYDLVGDEVTNLTIGNKTDLNNFIIDPISGDKISLSVESIPYNYHSIYLENIVGTFEVGDILVDQNDFTAEISLIEGNMLRLINRTDGFLEGNYFSCGEKSALVKSAFLSGSGIRTSLIIPVSSNDSTIIIKKKIFVNF